MTGPARRQYRATDPDVIEAAQAALDALNPTPAEREIARLFEDIPDEVAQEIALILTRGQR